VRSDPRIGLIVSLVAATAGVFWLLAQWLFADTLFAALSYGMHAITLVTILLVAAAPAVALLFWLYATVKGDLLVGRKVVARWQVDAARFRAVGKTADARDRAEKRGALYMILVLIVLAFGAIALFDLEAAPAMLVAAAILAAVIALAYWLGERARRSHLEFRSRDVIVGSDGLLVNDVLHVWATPLSWLAGVEIESKPYPAAAITYAYWTNVGPQFQTVILPLPADRPDLGPLVQNALTERGRARGKAARRHARGARKAG
jgi:hypothetical protein